MSTTNIERPVELSGSPPDEGTLKLREQIVPVIQELTEKKDNWGFLEGKDAALYLSLSSVPAPVKEPIDIPSLLSKLSSLLPKDPQLARRARKLAWHLSKGRHVTCEWDYVFLSELTHAESCMSDDAFAVLYPDQVKTPTKKGGRPRKYRTAKARKRGHAECQRRYVERKLPVVADVTKTPSQLAEK